MMILLDSEFTELYSKLEKAGINPISDDYVLVLGTDVRMVGVLSPVEVIVNKDAPEGAVYFTKRSSLKESEQ